MTLELIKVLNTIHEYIKTNSINKILYGNNNDVFIDYINDVLYPWYSYTDKNKYDKYDMFILNGFYNILFNKYYKASITLFSNQFYEKLLNIYPDYIPYVINIFVSKNSKQYESYDNKYLNDFMGTHNVKYFMKYTEDVKLCMQSIVKIYNYARLCDYYNMNVYEFLCIISQLFALVKIYGKHVFNKHVYKRIYCLCECKYEFCVLKTLFEYLCDCFGISLGWKFEPDDKLCFNRYGMLTNIIFCLFMDNLDMLETCLKNYCSHVLECRYYNTNYTYKKVIKYITKLLNCQWLVIAEIPHETLFIESFIFDNPNDELTNNFQLMLFVEKTIKYYHKQRTNNGYINEKLLKTIMDEVYEIVYERY